METLSTAATHGAREVAQQHQGVVHRGANGMLLTVADRDIVTSTLVTRSGLQEWVNNLKAYDFIILYMTYLFTTSSRSPIPVECLLQGSSKHHSFRNLERS